MSSLGSTLRRGRRFIPPFIGLKYSPKRDYFSTRPGIGRTKQNRRKDVLKIKQRCKTRQTESRNNACRPWRVHQFPGGFSSFSSFFFLCALPRPQLVPKYFDTPKPNTEKVKPRLPHPGTQIFSKTCQDQRSPSKRPPSFFSFCQN